MAATEFERERTYDYEDDAVPPDLHDLPGISTVEPAGTEDLDAVYYDTADRLLLAHHITLRRRTGGHDAGWHLKLPDGVDRRREVRLPVDSGGPDTVPADLELRVRARAHGQALQPVARLHTHRRRRLLLDEAGRPLAEIAEDAVSARVPERSEGTELVVLREWSEVEAELDEGDVALLDALEQRFVDAGLSRSPVGSKLARALSSDSGPGRADGASGASARPGSVGEMLGAQITREVAAVLALDGAVRRDLPDSVHQLRIAVRRLRSTLRAHRLALERPAAKALAAELRWLGHCLGDARDSEVLGRQLAAQARDLPEVARPGPVRQRIAAWSAERYQEARAPLVAALDSERYYRLLAGLEDFAAAPVPGSRTGRDAHAHVRHVLTREQKRVSARLDTAQALPPGDERDGALHAARRAAKRARYAGEGAEPFAGKKAHRFARRMKAVQSLLGERQDAVLARRALPGIAASAHAHGEPGFGYGVLYAAQEARLARTDAELPGPCAAARHRRLTRRI